MPTLNGQDLIEQTTPTTPPTGRLALYPKSDHKIYIKDSTGLETQIGAQGPQGIQGIQGNPGATGPEGPIGPTGLTGSTGSQGIQGNQGVQGNPGTPGSKWYTASGVPSTGIGVVGDFYLDLANGDYYEKTSAAIWTLRGNLKGPTGLTGNTGAQGNTGSTGAAGAKWFSSAGVPAGATGVIGDWHLNSTNGDYSEKTGASSWTIRGNLKGPQGNIGNTGNTGAQGNPGVDGEKWFTNIGAPTTGLGVIGDLYLDTATGDYYEKTGTSVWTLRGNLRGPQGIQGNTGSQGIKGDTGATGSQGIQGNPGATGATGSQGAQGIQGVKGDKGDKGDQGNPGPIGPTGEGVHPGGLTGQVLIKNTDLDFDTSWATIDASSVADLQLQVAALTVRVDELEAKITTLTNNPIFPGPEVGVTVHLKNVENDCVEAVIYEDATRRNNTSTISVVYVDPDNPTWLKRADVKAQNGSLTDVPFNNWHMPEWNIDPTMVRKAYARRKS